MLRAAAALLMLVAGCSTASRAPRATKDPSLITATEIQSTNYANAYQVVQALRPNWMRGRGPTSLRTVETVKVYLDDTLLGTVDQMKSISRNSVTQIRFMNGTTATQRFGIGHGQGVILVSTRPPAP